jgi:hypothetical protein
MRRTASRVLAGAYTGAPVLMLLGEKDDKGRPPCSWTGARSPSTRMLAACVAAGPGYTLAFDGTTRNTSTADTVAFLQRHLDP